jgi:hypothetical protein
MKNAIVAVLLLAALALPGAAQVKITPQGDKIAIQIDGKPFGDFYVKGETATKPYLWPMRAASGTAVTRSWPMEEIAEEASEKKDHIHQRGLWLAHEVVIPSSTNVKLDFWNNDASYVLKPLTPGSHLGKMVLQGQPRVKSGKEGTIEATFDWMPMTGGAPMLTESRLMTFYSDPVLRIIDIDATFTALEKVTFGDSKDGTLGMRLRPALQEDKGVAKLTNADGLVTEKALWGKTSKWCDDSGEVNGEKLGVAVMDHPGNPRPARWHARAYGLMAANPFGLNVFTNDKSQDGSAVLEKGQKLRFRYRIVIHPGDAAAAKLDQIYARYAAIK